MGTVFANIVVMPEDPSVDIENLRGMIADRIPEGVKLEGVLVKPLAFGLKALHVRITMPDGVEGGTDKVEAALSDLPNVQRVETTDVGLL